MGRKPIFIGLASLLRRVGAEETFEIDEARIDPGDLNALVRGVRLKVTNCGGSIMVQGAFRAWFPLQCSRCLAQFEARVEEAIAESIPIRPAADTDDGVEADYEYDVPILHGSRLDIEELIRQQILMAIPMIPLCSDLCEGLCPDCGEKLRDCRCAGGAGADGPETEFGRILANALENAEGKTEDHRPQTTDQGPRPAS